MVNSGMLARAVRALAATVALVVLAGCATTSTELTLQDVKSPLQLLRNQTASAVPAADIDHITHPSDSAIPCHDDAADPEHKWLTWQSSVLIYLTFDASSDMTAFRNELAAGFQDRGWTQGVSDSLNQVRLQRKGSIAVIDLYTTGRVKSTRTGGQLRVDVTGPCVLTAGASSEEVRRLLGR
jgi:hypothetical protein